MASCVENIFAKNYQNLIIGFQVTVKNVGDVFLRHSVDAKTYTLAVVDADGHKQPVAHFSTACSKIA